MHLGKALLGLVLGGTISTSASAAPYIGVQFYQEVGPHSQLLSSTDEAGVVPQINFNNVLENRGNSTSADLVDASGVATGVTLTHSASDSWTTGAYKDPGRTDPNAKLLDGASKSTQHTGTDPSIATYTFNDVPDGIYDLIVYTVGDVVGIRGSYTVGSAAFYVTNQRGADYAGNFIQATNTDPNGTMDVGNYIVFENISPIAGAISLTAQKVGDSVSGVAVNGFQLVAVPEPASFGPIAIAGLSLLRRKRWA